PDHPIRPAALVCRSDEICRSVGLRFEDGLSDGLSDGRSVSHTAYVNQMIISNSHNSRRKVRLQLLIETFQLYYGKLSSNIAKCTMLQEKCRSNRRSSLPAAFSSFVSRTASRTHRHYPESTFFPPLDFIKYDLWLEVEKA
ncbi:hypothetical protein HZ326_24096, partial [Fusarium oxysporum f. sp. albedinis]